MRRRIRRKRRRRRRKRRRRRRRRNGFSKNIYNVVLQKPKIFWIKRSRSKDTWRNVDHRGDCDQICVVRRRPSRLM